ncbi:hypothetical protein PV729_04405 [Streptomyces europaeiscabiei]|uniref:Uncharacterized protein n=1 Tax=Streptomyces europaeiscabiei TaxID=146819 RepID=A0ABU4NAD7_9ACTN|nr:hypothetical protein [Streptomyces europaeiscabiei]MDX3551020.1 hypothetical protein [Streptomyces europaeiscabiei]MDX3698420.1 hypothetical protein [Streptomyces europaeiscabiei]
MKAYRVKGTTDEVTTCELCGKQELKGTVVMATLDADGNEEAVCYFGVSCAAKAAGWTQHEVKAGVKVAKDAERERIRAEREAMWAAQRKFLEEWYMANYGTSSLHEAAKLAGMSTVRLSGEAIHAYREFQRAAEAPTTEPAEKEGTSSTDYRETTIRIAGTVHVVRTERGSASVRQLEAAHTKAVRNTIVAARKSTLPALEASAKAAEDAASGHRSGPALEEATRRRAAVRRAQRGTLPSWGTYNVEAAAKPFPRVRFTGKIPEYLTEVEPGHYVTQGAAF